MTFQDTEPIATLAICFITDIHKDFSLTKIKLVGRQRRKISPAEVCPPDSSSLDILTQKLGCNRTDSIWPKTPNHPVIHWKEVAVVELNSDLSRAA